MANLLSIAELAWRQLFPNPGDENAVSREEFIATAKTEYAYQLWLKIKQDKVQYGESEVPSYLLSQVDLPIVDNAMDISELKILRSIDQELWLQDIGGFNCKCTYIKSTQSMSKVLCDDDSLPEDAKTYYPIGKKIIFPAGTHADTLSITYANSGEKIDDMIEIDDMVAGLIRRSLIEIYGGKMGQEDKTDNSNSNQTQNIRQ